MTAERIAELRARWTNPPNPVVIELLDELDITANLERERDAATERAEKAEDIINTMLRCVGKNAGNVNDPVAAIKATYRSLVDARERAERAEALAMAREIGADLSASEVQRAEQQIATLTSERDEATGTLARIAARLDITPDSDIPLLLDVRLRRYEHDALVESSAKLRTQKMELPAEVKRVACERDGFIVELASAKALDAQARTDWDRLTGELEAERAGSAAMRKGLETIAHCSESFRPLVRDLLSSTAGVEYLATMAAYRLALDRSGCACRSGNVQLGESPYKCLRCVTLESRTAGAETLERLRKTEAERDNLADCWQKAEGALNDMEIAKNERIATLEARDLTLRRRIHAMERHNQWFERCESPWCNPSGYNDPASQPHGDAFAVRMRVGGETELASTEVALRPTCDGTPLPDGRPRCGFVDCSCHGGDRCATSNS